MSQEHLPDPPISELRWVVNGVINEGLGGYQDMQYPDADDRIIWHAIQFRQMADGSWRVDDSDGIRAHGARGTYRITVNVERVDGT